MGKDWEMRVIVMHEVKFPKKNQLKYTKKERKKKTVIVKGKFIYANKFLHEKDKNLH